ncbi:MAG: hypothetical protein HY965_05745 [Ignavibacteriales bacterium]|nr:hypothetical protein [Ignavibacteriales bacterium]
MKKLLFFFVIFTIVTFSQEKVDVSPKFYGFIRGWHQTDFAKNQGAFSMKEARLGIRGNVNETFSYKLLTDFARLNAGVAAKNEIISYTDSTGAKKTKSVTTSVSSGITDLMVDAEVTFTPVKSFSITAGQFVIPFGLENQKGNADIDFVNRTLLYAVVTPELRDIGVMASYSSKVPFGYNFKAGIYNGSGQNKAETDLSNNFSIRAGVQPLEGLGFSGSFYNGRVNNSKTNIIGVSADVSALDFTFAGEFVHRNTDTGAKEYVSSGFYGYGYYDYVISEGMLTHILPGVRFESVEPNDGVAKDGYGRLAFGATLQFAKMNYAKFRINFETYTYENTGTDSINRLVFEFLARF